MVPEMRLEGFDAIEYAEANGLMLEKYADPIEDARQVSVEEAMAIAREDQRLIYLDVRPE